MKKLFQTAFALKVAKCLVINELGGKKSAARSRDKQLPASVFLFFKKRRDTIKVRGHPKASSTKPAWKHSRWPG